MRIRLYTLTKNNSIKKKKKIEWDKRNIIYFYFVLFNGDYSCQVLPSGRVLCIIINGFISCGTASLIVQNTELGFYIFTK